MGTMLKRTHIGLRLFEYQLFRRAPISLESVREPLRGWLTFALVSIYNAILINEPYKPNVMNWK
jgi:hypothetical protein